MNYELQVLLGLNCNFKCSHCLNNSGPGNRDQDISDSEVELLFETISLNKSIKTVSFSGGEPLLYIARIESLISKLRAARSDLKFSITTNGSLIARNELILKQLKIDYAMLSFDKEHTEFIESENFIEALSLSLGIFKKFEVNITYEDSPHYQPVRKFLLDNNIKVNFTQTIESGRKKARINQNHEIGLTSFSCPNLNTSDKSAKISFIPKKGFSICCGPVVFDNLVDSSVSFFQTFEMLQQNTLYKFLKKISNIQISTEKGVSCQSCKSALKSTSKEELDFFINRGGWNNILLKWDDQKLQHYNKLFNPKIVKKVDVGLFNNYLEDRKIISEQDIIKTEGDNLHQNEINEFSQFTIESFYDVHTAYYSVGDIVRFKNDQKIFFNLPNKYIHHKIDGKIVGYLAVCQLEQHPFFKVKAWHVGYWGINQDLKKTERDLIKSDWANLLKALNADAIITANIDFFNTPADRLSEKFNLKPTCVRLDPRQ